MAMDLGDTIMYGGMVRAANRAAAAAQANALKNIDRITETAKEIIDKRDADYNELVERALANVHSLRARGAAHEEVEAEMARIIAEYDPTNPLAFVENIEKIVNLKHVEKSSDPEVVKWTYRDGEIKDREKYLETDADGSSVFVKNPI